MLEKLFKTSTRNVVTIVMVYSGGIPISIGEGDVITEGNFFARTDCRLRVFDMNIYKSYKSYVVLFKRVDSPLLAAKMKGRNRGEKGKKENRQGTKEKNKLTKCLKSGLKVCHSTGVVCGLQMKATLL